MDKKIPRENTNKMELNHIQSASELLKMKMKELKEKINKLENDNILTQKAIIEPHEKINQS